MPNQPKGAISWSGAPSPMRLALVKRSKPQARHAAGGLVNDFAGAARFASAGARP